MMLKSFRVKIFEDLWVVIPYEKDRLRSFVDIHFRTNIGLDVLLFWLWSKEVFFYIRWSQTAESMIKPLT